ncbi:hypothetical protein ACW0JT_10860 [Arthrobacter sp. SA17]
MRAGDSLLVSSPPGTGQTQTAINTIGALVDEGKSVLVVGTGAPASAKYPRSWRAWGWNPFFSNFPATPPRCS